MVSADRPPVAASSSEHTEDLDIVFQTEKFAVEEMRKSEFDNEAKFVLSWEVTEIYDGP